ncbi:hypothetical protein AN958_05557 [Leucoagaricus sp. SymC.cos]|nr:hypothetical protein AN958_05557 [Leucoagaricus sp. SymC.cos]
MDFMQNHDRSKEIGIHAVMKDFRIEMFNRLNFIHSRSQEGRIATDAIEIAWEYPGISKEVVYCFLVTVCLQLCMPICPLDSQSAALLSGFDFRFTLTVGLFIGHPFSPGELMRNIPPEFHSKIVRRLPFMSHQVHALVNVEEAPYILGHNENSVLCWKYSHGEKWFLAPNWTYLSTSSSPSIGCLGNSIPRYKSLCACIRRLFS